MEESGAVEEWHFYLASEQGTDLQDPYVAEIESAWSAAMRNGEDPEAYADAWEQFIRFVQVAINEIHGE